MSRRVHRIATATLLTTAAFLAPGFSSADPQESEPSAQPPDHESRGGYVTVTYLANEGVMISGPSGKVLIDALIGDGLAGYESVAGRERRHLERAAAPYDDVDMLLATHHHADHFYAAAVLGFLENSPSTRFVSTPEAVARLAAAPGFGAVADRVREAAPKAGEREEIVLSGLRLQLLNITHGPRRPPIPNLGVLLEIDGLKLLHLGDSEAGLEVFRGYELDQERIDVALVPFWYFLSEGDRAAVRDGLRAHTLIPIHVPAADAPASYFGGPGGRGELLRQIEESLPNVTAFHATQTRRRFPVRLGGATAD